MVGLLIVVVIHSYQTKNLFNIVCPLSFFVSNSVNELMVSLTGPTNVESLAYLVQFKMTNNCPLSQILKLGLFLDICVAIRCSVSFMALCIVELT